MGIEDKEIILLSLDFQSYLTYISVVCTVAISFLVAILSYIFVNIKVISQSILILLLLITIFMEIAFVAVYFWIDRKKEDLKERIRNN